jgi:hypothetical protein
VELLLVSGTPEVTGHFRIDVENFTCELVAPADSLRPIINQQPVSACAWNFNI